MTDVVHKAVWDKQIKVTFLDLIRSDSAYWRQGHISWKLSWQDGKLINTKNGEEIFAYHFVESKNKPGFDITPCIDKIKKISISDKKIECNVY